MHRGGLGTDLVAQGIRAAHRVVQTRGRLEGHAHVPGRLDEGDQARGSGKRVGRKAARADLGAQLMPRDNAEVVWRRRPDAHFHVHGERRRERLREPGDAVARRGPAFDRVHADVLIRRALVERLHRRRILVHVLADDRADGPAPAVVRVPHNSVGQHRQLHRRHDESSEHPGVGPGQRSSVFREGVGQRELRRRKQPGVIHRPGHQGAGACGGHGFSLPTGR